MPKHAKKHIMKQNNNKKKQVNMKQNKLELKTMSKIF